MSDNMHGFKAYEPGLICRGHKYEENTVYKKSGHGICTSGVTHYCINPFDVLDYYPLVRPDGQFSDFTTVEAIDQPVTDDNKKFATSTIKIGVKLGFSGFIKACVDFLFEKTIKKMPKPEGSSATDGASHGERTMPNTGEFPSADGESAWWLTLTGIPQGTSSLNISEQPSIPVDTKLSQILEENPDPQYNLTATACAGILRRAERRGKQLPEMLKAVLIRQSSAYRATE